MSGQPRPPGPPVTPDGVVPLGPVVIRRLTAEQIRNSVRDVLGIDIPAEQPLEGVSRPGGLKSLGAAESGISERGTEMLQDAFETASRLAFADPKGRMALVPCAPSGPGDKACARRLIETLGARLWRRPLLAAEADRMSALLLDASGRLGDFWKAAELVVAGMMQSPKFLFRSELGEPDPAVPGRLRYTGYDMAARLSFLFLDSTPDTALIAAAAAGKLSTPNDIRAQAERLVATPRARAAVMDFFDDYLSISEVETTTKDAMAFPLFDSALARSMKEETRRLVDHLLSENADIRQLMNTRTTFVDASLARLYGLPSKEGFTRTELPAAGIRRGLLGHASLLARLSYAAETAPVKRGVWIQEQLRCLDLLPEPDDDSVIMSTEAKMGPTARDRLALHRQKGSACAGCHSLMDPMGLALENFDGIGAFRETENGKTIDASGDLDGQPFSNAGELADLLSRDPEVSACLVKNAYAHALGRSALPGEVAVIKELGRKLEAGSYRMSGFFIDVAMSDGFRYASTPR